MIKIPFNCRWIRSFHVNHNIHDTIQYVVPVGSILPLCIVYVGWETELRPCNIIMPCKGMRLTMKWNAQRKRYESTDGKYYFNHGSDKPRLPLNVPEE